MDNKELIKLAQRGDDYATDKLVKQNSALVWSIVKRFLRRGVEAEDLYQIGCIGLIKAVRKFDVSYNTAFSTYAVPLIMGEIKRFMRDDGIIKVSRSLRELGAKVYAVSEKYRKENNCEPTLEQIAEILGEPRENITAALDAICEPVSLYTVNSDDEEVFLPDIVKPVNYEDKLVDGLSLKIAIGKLEKREKEIINMRYYGGKTQSQVAEVMGISQVQVSRIEKKVLKKLHGMLDEVI